MSTKFIVALGSSEGGVEALKIFFDHTPHDQATYIILRHIPMTARSELHQVLRRYSKLTIVEAENDTDIKADTVYIPPASSYMIIKNNKLFLIPRVEGMHLYNKSVDIFLESLAKDKAEKSIAIIFSGVGDDGANGVTMIKKAGGMVIAQDPESCSFPDMPKNAIATGCVDYILLPAEMPKLVVEYANPILKKANGSDRLKGIAS